MQKNERLKWIYQDKGGTLSYLDGDSKIISKDGLYFKNLSRSGRLEKYEDWRLSPEERAGDLAGRLDVEQMAGLMAFSLTCTVPSDGRRQIHGGEHTFGGKNFLESGAEKSELSDQIREMLLVENIRALYVGGVENTADMVKWVNKLQMLAESRPFGIPVCIGSDSRHGVNSKMRRGFEPGEGISLWPDGIGMAALYDADMMREAAKIQAREYRAMGMTHILGPQMDLTTDPRWSRFGESLGANTSLAIDLSKSYIEGFQTSEDLGAINGWGKESVICVAKHFPGGATGEGGRDAHYNYGKYAVYPGGNLHEHLSVFKFGALVSGAEASRAASIMPYYSIPYDQDIENGENTGTGFNKYFLQDILIKEYGFDGVICSDWEIITGQGEWVDVFAGKCWGVEEMSPGQRVFKAMSAGVNQFGGVNTTAPILEGYRYGCKALGGETMLKLMRGSCEKILRNMFRIRLFENPYLDIDQSLKIHYNSTSLCRGKAAQRKSVVMLKNKNQLLPAAKGQFVYIPQTRSYSGVDCLPAGAESFYSVYSKAAGPNQADFAVIFMNEPGPRTSSMDSMGNYNRGYDIKDYQAGGNGYVPISLQYGPYTADKARKYSLSPADPMDKCDRSYWGKTVCNETVDLEILKQVRQTMERKPVIVVLALRNPCCIHEIEPLADVILLDMWLEKDIIVDIVSGIFEPRGLLPFPMPLNMETVETHCEDTVWDIECYRDELGHVYETTYGLNYQGIIQDERVKKYRGEKLNTGALYDQYAHRDSV